MSSVTSPPVRFVRLSPEAKAKLSEIARAQDRTMKAVLARLIDREHETTCGRGGRQRKAG